MNRHKHLFGRQKEDVELASEFGTYNIQRTADTENAFPAIAQGLPRGLNHASDLQEKDNATHR